MKKMVISIIVLTIIFVGMVIYKNNIIHSKNDITINEIQEIEEYINKIYMWKEITNEALPKFDNINNADEKWIWEVVKKDLEEYEVTYEQIQEKATQIFGTDMTRQFPKKGTQGLVYDEIKQKYIATETQLDNKDDSFLLNKIEKTKDGYEVEIVEYIEEYIESTNEIIIRNINDEEIAKINIKEPEEKVQEIVKSSLDKFSKKEIELKKEIRVVSVGT